MKRESKRERESARARKRERAREEIDKNHKRAKGKVMGKEKGMDDRD